ncbi:MAG: hypothetical protein KatS3mg060_1140 [Dehalococcoidia bacterium]|nr:MAG: hypothetical protein KatS3mg060_1140 [Dehalococcoidia bacterium]
MTNDATFSAIVAARRRLLVRQPWLAEALLAIDWQPSVSCPALAVSRSGRGYYNPNLLRQYKDFRQPGVLEAALEHELGHLLRLHWDRAEAVGAADRVFNVAGDAEINDDIAGAPDSWVFPRTLGRPEHLPAEAYLAAAAEWLQQQQGTNANGTAAEQPPADGATTQPPAADEPAKEHEDDGEEEEEEEDEEEGEEEEEEEDENTVEDDDAPTVGTGTGKGRARGRRRSGGRRGTGGRGDGGSSATVATSGGARSGGATSSTDASAGEGDEASEDGNAQTRFGAGDCGSAADGVEREYERGDDRRGMTPSEIRAIAQRVAQAARAAGTATGGWRQWAEEVLRPRGEPWRALLERHLTRPLAGGAVPHRTRRLSSRSGPLTPRLRWRELGARIGVLLDVSGSMASDVPLAAGVAERVAARYGADLVYVTCDVTASRPCRTYREALQQPVGGGGTDLRVGIKALEAAGADVILVVTDGETPWPAPDEARVPVVVALVGERPGYPPAYLPAVRVESDA